MELGVDPIALRRQNFITEFPYATPVAVEYDTGDYHATMDKLEEIADMGGFEARRAESEAKGKLRGLGRELLYRGLRHCAVEPCWPAWARARGCMKAPPCGSMPPAGWW